MRDCMVNDKTKKTGNFSKEIARFFVEGCIALFIQIRAILHKFNFDIGANVNIHVRINKFY